jgi:hypothetical protein
MYRLCDQFMSDQIENEVVQAIYEVAIHTSTKPVVWEIFVFACNRQKQDLARCAIGRFERLGVDLVYLTSDEVRDLPARHFLELSRLRYSRAIESTVVPFPQVDEGKSYRLLSWTEVSKQFELDRVEPFVPRDPPAQPACPVFR